MFTSIMPIVSHTNVINKTISIVPFISHTNVINKTIVYSDTVLSLKETGNNLIISSISNVNESSLENCLKIIFESNPTVFFNTVQYSEKYKKVYFYTNKEITTKVYEESKFTKYQPITSRNEILEELNRILNAPICKDNSCVSLYDVLMILKTMSRKYGGIKTKYLFYCEKLVKAKINKDCFIRIHPFDYQNKTLCITYGKYFGYSGHIYFAKQNDDLYVVKSEISRTNEVFATIGSCLSKLFDELLQYVDYMDCDQAKENIKPVNSNFSVEINKNRIKILVKNIKNEFENEFENELENELELVAPSRYKSDYKFECNSHIITEAFKGNEEEVFKRIFVKISDCPKWSQTMLYEIRQNQIAEEQTMKI